MLANRHKRERLNHVRRLLGDAALTAAEPPPQTAAEWMLAVLGVEMDRCPVCGEVLHRESLARLPQPSARLFSATGIRVGDPPARAAPP